MIAIKCPACGAEGRAPKDKILARLICRKCLRVFHVTPSGMSVLGEPPTPGQSSTGASHESSSKDSSIQVDRLLENLSRKASSPTTWIVTGAVVLIALAAATFSSWRPESLEQRVSRAAKAAVQGDLQTIEALAASGTENNMGPWYVAIRPRSDDLLKRPGSDKLAVETEIKTQASDQDGVELIAWVYTSEDLARKGRDLPDTTITAASAGGLPISLPMVWRRESIGGWKLDLNRSLELSKSEPEKPLRIPTGSL